VNVPCIYLDTSVIGGYHDPEFAVVTRTLFEQIGEGHFRGVISSVVEEELLGAPERVRRTAVEHAFSVLRETTETVELANMYMRESVLAPKFINDCRHVAIAAVERVTLLVSWNFKHMVHFERIRAFNAVNLKCGLGLLDIRSPLEVIHRGP
jgi:predicted nucleic acid-binding protein